MMTFALYNFEFEIDLPVRESVDAFSGKSDAKTAKENFDKRQQLFSDLLDRDYNGLLTIPYTRKRGNSSYLRKWIAQPRDDMFVFRLINDHRRKLRDRDEKAYKADDFLGCYIIVDNYAGHQVIAIEDKPSAIGALSVTEDVLARAFNALLKDVYLKVRLEHIYDPATFWEIVGDHERYPKGFSSVKFNFPKPNLARFRLISKKLRDMIEDTGKGFQSDTTITMHKPHLDRDDETQAAYVNLSAEIGGDKSAILYPVGGNKVCVGQNHYRRVSIPDSVMDNLRDGSPTLFSQSPLDDIRAIIRQNVKSVNMLDEDTEQGRQQ